MSWNASVLVARSGVVEGLRAGVNAAYPERSTDMQEQVDAALRAVEALLPTIALEPQVVVSAVISGHANPSHRPAKGWANDCISIAVTQA